MDRSDPATVVDCRDRWGRSVLGRRQRWEGHVRPRHAELDDHFDAVRATIEEPEVVTFDATYPDRENFYRFGALPGHDRLYLKVCVGYGETGVSATLITAYPTGIIGRGEAQKWP